MHLALHPEIAERKEKGAPERRRMLSKMTNDEQEATEVTPRWIACVRPYRCSQGFPEKGWSPGRLARAGMVGAVVGN